MSDRWARHVDIRCLVICVFAVAGITFLLNSTLASEKSSEALFGESSISVPTDWHSMDSPAGSQVLSMIADQTQGNYEKLRTWQGTYHVRGRQYLAAGMPMGLPGTGGATTQQPSVWQEFDFTLHFVIDIASNSIYRSKGTKEMVFKDESENTVSIPNVSPLDERSIVTSEHFLHFDPKVVWPGFVYVLDHPEARNKHAAFRDDLTSSQRRHFGDLPDPRMFFCLTGERRFFWEEIRGLLRTWKDTKRFDESFLIVSQSSGLGGTWYRLAENFDPNPGSRKPGGHMIAIFSPTAGFNAVSVTMATDKAGDNPLSKRFWRWKRSDGVYVPEKIADVIYSAADGRLVYQREMDLQTSKINGPMDPSQFSYKGLGMKDGDLVMDNIDKVCLIIKNGGATKLANYNEKYIPPGTSRWTLPRVWFLTINTVLLIALIAAFIVRRYRKRIA